MVGVFNNPDAVAVIYVVFGLIFLFGMFAGTARTLARVVYYLRNGTQMPRLLIRDAICWGGFSVSFGLITLIRFLPPEQRIALTLGNVLWAIATVVPSCIAVFAYLYFEVWVIERAKTA